MKRCKQGLKALRQFFCCGWGMLFSVPAAVLFPFFAVRYANLIAFNDLELLQNFLTNRPKTFLYGVLAVGSIYLVLTLLSRRPWVGALVTGAMCIIMPAVDFFKMKILGEHFYPWDLFLTGEAGSFATFLKGLQFPEIFIRGVWLMVAYIFVLWLMGLRVGGPWLVRVPTAVVLSFALVFTVANNKVRKEWYGPLFDLSINHMSDQFSNYSQNGFVAAFTLSAGALNVPAPEGYDRAAMEQLVEQFSQSTGGETFQRPDVVVVLSEAYWDPTTLEALEFSQDPLPNYRRIIEDNPHGDYVSIAIGGGTIRPEFETLTGYTLSQLPPGTMPYQQYMRKDTWSYARYFKEMGYDTIGIHTYLPNFYGRNVAYPLMGFDEFRGKDVLHVPVEVEDCPYILDKTFVNELIYELDQPHEDGLFLFGISMENHATYWGKYPEGSEYPVQVTGGGLDEALLGNMESLCKGLKGADDALGKLYDYVQQRERPTVVLWFGDHLPAVGYRYEPFVSQWGISVEGTSKWSEKQKLQMLTTPFVVFSNYDTGVEFPGDGQPTSPSFIMNQLCDYMDAPSTPYRNMLREFWQDCPVCNAPYSLFLENVEPEKRYDWIHKQWLFTYDNVLGKQYSQAAQGKK